MFSTHTYVLLKKTLFCYVSDFEKTWLLQMIHITQTTIYIIGSTNTVTQNRRAVILTVEF